MNGTELMWCQHFVFLVCKVNTHSVKPSLTDFTFNPLVLSLHHRFTDLTIIIFCYAWSSYLLGFLDFTNGWFTTHFIDPGRMKGWVGWPVADGLPTLVVTHQLQVDRRTGKVRRPETDILPLCHATNRGAGRVIIGNDCLHSQRSRDVRTRRFLWAHTDAYYLFINNIQPTKNIYICLCFFLCQSIGPQVWTNPIHSKALWCDQSLSKETKSPLQRHRNLMIASAHCI